MPATIQLHCGYYRNTIARMSPTLQFTSAIAAVVVLAQDRVFADRATPNQSTGSCLWFDQQDQQDHDDRDSSWGQVRTPESISPINHPFSLEPVHNEPDIAQEENATYQTDNNKFSDS